MPKQSIGTIEAPPLPTPELVTAEEARKIVGVLSESDMYARIKDGRFPKPVRLSRKSIRFVKSECHAFVEKLIAERDLLEAERAKYGA